MYRSAVLLYCCNQILASHPASLTGTIPVHAPQAVPYLSPAERAKAAAEEAAAEEARRKAAADDCADRALKQVRRSACCALQLL
jgi:hypothetical protein